MTTQPDYQRAFARMLFVILILGLVMGPQLLSDNPGSGFSEIKSLFTETPLLTWIIIVAFAVFALSGVRYLRYRKPRTGGVTTDPGISPLAALPIEQAVTSERQGNGLATVAFPVPLRWRVLGWVEVQTPELECVIIDGHKIIRQTSLYYAPMRMVGKPVSVRRVLLKPRPVTIPTVKSLSLDGWPTEIDVNIIFSVSDPRRAIGQDPVKEFVHDVEGVIGEYIRSTSHEQLLGDRGYLRKTLQHVLQTSRVLQGFNIIEAAVTNIRGDERKVEVARQMQIEAARIPLLEITGQGKLIQMRYDLQIEEWKAALLDRVAQNAHLRDMEKLRMQLESGNLQSVMAMLAQIGSSGMDPTGVMSLVQQFMASQSYPVVNSGQGGAALPEPLIVMEERLLRENQQNIGILTFSLEPQAQRLELPGKLAAKFENFMLGATCPGDYPHSAPTVRIMQEGTRDPFTLPVPWQPGGRLIEVAVTAAMQAPFEIEKRRKDDADLFQ